MNHMLIRRELDWDWILVDDLIYWVTFNLSRIVDDFIYWVTGKIYMVWILEFITNKYIIAIR